ncbi:hypothetical protein [Motiliproteus sp. MSK22-1]|uniref:hypothetical protein n=1 Tax=Motiliproteus sp. MSK22-1 TaxID=1897630 RepID=UPI00117EC384|nr:hypothetical protein [Motiliproteus sp. MSK22-1]
MGKTYRRFEEIDSRTNRDENEFDSSRNRTRNQNHLDVRRCMDDYFERKHFEEKEDWHAEN